MTALYGERVRRRQFPGLAEDGARFGDVAEREVFFDRQRVDVARQPAVRQQGFEFGTEKQRAIRQKGVVQRFDRQAVAREKEGLTIAIPQGKSKHAAKTRHAIFAPGFPGVHDHLGVAACMEDVTERLQFRNEFLVVVDFAVKDDANAAVLVEQGLLAGCQVDDRQAPVTKAEAGFEMQVALHRPAMVLALVHAVKHGTINFAPAAGVKNSGYSTHIQFRFAVEIVSAFADFTEFAEFADFADLAFSNSS